MTQHFRSKSCGLVGLSDFKTAPRNSFYNKDKEDEEEEEEKHEFEEEGYDDEIFSNPISTPFISPESRANATNQQGRHCHTNGQNQQFAILDVLVAALRKSLVTCSVEKDDVSSSMDIGSPTEVKHVSHVTFDRFNGFLDLPAELEPKVPRKVPSASASVFGVSVKSMQCSYDDKGNSLPTILLMMQKRLYAGGGLQEEGIFRINAENSQEEHVRNQLNRGVLPHGIDVHCLAGLIKAWYRELPNGVLDSLTPEQVMHCNTEDDCTKLLKLLPPTEAALLDWAINLMADVVHHEQHNKMNARNIAMVFAPNMTQMADPLTALIHAVQVMNFLKTLILKTLREREEFKVAKAELSSPCSISPNHNSGLTSELNKSAFSKHDKETMEPICVNSLGTMISSSLDKEIDEKLWCSEVMNDTEDNFELISGISTPGIRCAALRENECDDSRYEGGDWQRLRKGMRKLCRHPVLQLSRPTKKTDNLGIVNTREGGGETWA